MNISKRRRLFRHISRATGTIYMFFDALDALGHLASAISGVVRANKGNTLSSIPPGTDGRRYLTVALADARIQLEQIVLSMDLEDEVNLRVMARLETLAHTHRVSFEEDSTHPPGYRVLPKDPPTQVMGLDFNHLPGKGGPL